jgi:hypothetical protein
MWVRVLQSLDANPRWIPPGTVVIVQIAPAEQKALSLDHLMPYDERRYGNTLLWFFEAVGEAE